MPLPLIPAAVIGLGSLGAGLILGGDRSDAQVVVNPSGGITLTQVALLSSVAVAALVVVPPLLKR